MSALVLRSDRGTVVLTGDSTIGRDGDDVLADPYMSREHARFYPSVDGWYVEDLGTTNGTWVGPLRVYSPIRLRVGDVVKMGHTLARVEETT